MYNVAIPTPGFGTFRLQGDTAKHAVEKALNAGFTHIDTAQIYANEADVGTAIAKAPRKRLFITTKVWFDNLTKDKFLPSVEQSLEKLNTDYVDLLLIHWPSPGDKVPMQEYLTELISAMHKGMTRAVGVSNFTKQQLEDTAALIGVENITCNQVEVHPFFQNQDLVKYCQSQGITVVGYMPIANGKVMQSEVLQAIADEHATSPASIAIAWQIQQGIVPIPASTNAEHIEANLAARDIRLTPDQMAQIATLDSNQRMIDPDFAPDW